MVYDFAAEVQDDVLKLMVKDAIFSSAAFHWVKPEYFEGTGRQWMARFFLEFYEKYSMPPTSGQVATEAVQRVKSGSMNGVLAGEVGSLVRSIYRVPLAGAREYTLELVQKFARHRAWENAIISSHAYLQKGDYDKVDEIMMAAQNAAVDLDAGAYWYFEARKERARRRRENDEKPVLPTGIIELDFHLRKGGVCPGEVALWMAPKGRGKSIGLCHVARRAIFEGWKVAYYSFEMSDEQNADRLDAGFSGVKMWDMEEHGEEVLERLDDLAVQFPRSLMIKQYPTKGRTIQDIRRHLDTLRRLEGWEPDVVVLDYIGIVKPSRALDGRHAEMQEVLEDFRGLCVELDCVGWTAAQVNRTGAKKRTADGTDAAGSWDQLATADYVFILNQEPHERIDEEIRIFIDKCRDGRSDIEVGPLTTDWAKMCFIRRSNKTRMEVAEDWENRKELLTEDDDV